MGDIVGGIYDGGGSKPYKWGEEPGQWVDGTIVAIRQQQEKEFGTDKLVFWPDGSPKMTPIVTLQTETFEDDDHDGRYDLYLRGNQYTAFRDALHEAFDRRPTDEDLIGCRFVLKLEKRAPSQRGQPRKIFRAKIWPKSVAGDVFDDPQSSTEESENPAPQQQQATAARPPAQAAAPDPQTTGRPAGRTQVQPTAKGAVPF